MAHPDTSIAAIRELEALVGAETGVDATALDDDARAAYRARLDARVPDVLADHQAAAARSVQPAATPSPPNPAPDSAAELQAQAQAALAAVAALPDLLARLGRLAPAPVDQPKDDTTTT